MRVLIAHSFYRVPGGEDRYVRQQFELLSGHHDVEMVERHNDALEPELSTAVRMAFSPAAIQEIEDQIDAFRPDVIHLHNPYPSLGPAVHVAAARRGVPLVQTVHNLRLRCPNGLMFTEGRSCRRCERGNYVNAAVHRCFPSRRQAGAYAGALWLHRFLLKLERNVAAFVAPSVFMAARLREWGFPEARISTIRNFVPSVAAAPSNVGDFGVYVGRLSGEKGLPVLLEALALAGDPPFRIIGDGPLLEDLKTAGARLGLRRTEFVGRVEAPDAHRAVAGCRFLVMPSLCEENAPLAALEALAAGRPVLVSGRGGLPELVESGGGLVFDPGDASSLSENIQALVLDRNLCQRLGDRAWGFAAAELGRDRHLERLLELYGALRWESHSGGSG
ncbi:MAG TPA: glycosyltransferase [Actinomycetota bacterium]|jgi:glycosyltransferase involved in cell wall biosynthesis|nr:glycosyltransferase [Actinomycetota bacterium]